MIGLCGLYCFYVFLRLLCTGKLFWCEKSEIGNYEKMTAPVSKDINTNGKFYYWPKVTIRSRDNIPLWWRNIYIIFEKAKKVFPQTTASFSSIQCLCGTYSILRERFLFVPLTLPKHVSGLHIYVEEMRCIQSNSWIGFLSFYPRSLNRWSAEGSVMSLSGLECKVPVSTHLYTQSKSTNSASARRDPCHLTLEYSDIITPNCLVQTLIGVSVVWQTITPDTAS